MTRGQPTLLDPLRRLINRQGGCALSDSQLLEQYATRGDAASFEVLVWRHGAMVLGLCKRILREEHEAEDAFQATFLVFARKAGSVGRGEAVGCWLYKVAYRVALRLRSTRIKHSAGEIIEEPLAPEQPDDATWRDLRPVLDEEISRLPEKYRAPFVLCYLQGRTNEEAAVELGCPKGTVLSRLARGREWLRDRLTRRGLAPAAVALALNLSSQHASAAVPALLAQSTAGAAIPFAAGTAAEVLPAHVAALAEGVIRIMIATKLKIAAAALVALSVLGSGIGWAAFGDGQDRRAANPVAERGERGEPQERGAAQPQPDGVATYHGKVVTVAKDGKSFTLESPPTRRGDDPRKHTIKIDDKTAMTFERVGPDGAKLTEGYAVVVWLAAGSADTAGRMTVMPTADGREMRRGPDIIGVLTAVGDGKSITLEIISRPSDRGAEPERKADPDKNTVTIPFDNKTVVSFLNVAIGGAKTVVGMRTSVTLADDGKTAATVQYIGSAARGAAGGGGFDPKRLVSGKVVGIADAGKTLTVESPPSERGGEPTKTTVKLTDKSSVVFNNVPADGAKIAEGQTAQVMLVADSKDTAATVQLIGTVPERWTTITGKVVAVAKDGSAVTIEQPAAARGEEPKRTEVKLAAKTKIMYSRVGPGEAKPAEGMTATARLLDGSTDTASTVTFAKPGEGRRER
jgi:RNA polymerase sigma factor (sigma-70 family)